MDPSILTPEKAGAQEALRELGSLFGNEGQSHRAGRVIVRREPVLLIRKAGSTLLTGRLLFKPSQILEVKRSDGFAFSGELFTSDGTLLTAAEKRGLPFLAEEDMFPPESSPRSIARHEDGERYLHFSEGHYFHDLQTYVDYETDERWTGPMPVPQGDKLPNLARRLASGKEISVVLLGDSISKGANASARTQAPPFQPAYGALAMKHLEEKFGARIQFHNLSEGGKTSSWGLDQVAAVCDHQPDLVILAFGMNDASENVTAEVFCRNLRMMVERIQAKVPQAEFILISGMTPNSSWHLSRPALRKTMHEQLMALASMGVAVCDVRSVWEELVLRKGFDSLTGNGVNHPNDFGHRVYADCVIASLGIAFQADENN